MFHIGTAGYSYKDWIGPFYPEGIKDTAMLDYYSTQFSFVEINSSFYHMPSVRLFDSLGRKTPQDFRFSVKLFGGFTHQRDSGRKEAGEFLYSIRPLQEKNKLLCLLAQFPYSFHYNPENLDLLRNLREWFGNVDINIEFRNRGWIRDETLSVLRESNLGFVCVDEPQIKGLIDKTAVATSNVGYLRMHGRNASKWYAGEGSARYDYLYSFEELNEWLPAIIDLKNKTMEMVVSFNNHPIGKAVENARMLEIMLGI